MPALPRSRATRPNREQATPPPGYDYLIDGDIRPVNEGEASAARTAGTPEEPGE